MFENPRRGRQARNFTANVPKSLDVKLSSEQIFSENWHWVSLITLCLKKVCFIDTFFTGLSLLLKKSTVFTVKLIAFKSTATTKFQWKVQSFFKYFNWKIAVISVFSSSHWNQD